MRGHSAPSAIVVIVILERSSLLHGGLGGSGACIGGSVRDKLPAVRTPRRIGLGAALAVVLVVAPPSGAGAQAAEAPAAPEPGSAPAAEPAPAAKPAPAAAPEPAAKPAPTSDAGSEPAADAEPGSDAASEADAESDAGGDGLPPVEESESESESESEEEEEEDEAQERDPLLSAPIDCAFCEEFASQVAAQKIVYRMQRVEVRGNTTRDAIVESFVPLDPGDELDPNDEAIALTRWRLMATGWFDDVRLSLEKGKERGWVVLVVEVEERNTLVIERVVAGLSRVVVGSSMMKDSLRPYGGVGITDVNLFGLGAELSGAVVVSELQQGYQLRYQDRHIGSSGGFSLRGRAFHNNAREFFGRDAQVDIACDPVDPSIPIAQQQPCDMDVERRRAVVIYNRTGLGIGTGHDIKSTLRYTVDWLGERVNVDTKPRAANSQRGTRSTDREPIDFHIEDEISYVSSLRLGFIFDRRDHPTMPGSGSLMRASAQLATEAFGSDYAFTRLDIDFRKYFTLPWGHGLRLGVFAGSVFGPAPFFYHFYAADLSDLLPARQLELNLDHRRTHNLLSTSIGEMDKEELAGRLDFEYRLPLYSGGKDIKGMHFYAGGGVFMLSRRDDLRLGIPGYDGLEAVPVDLTFDVGVFADTSLGIFKVGFSSLIGFLPDLGQDNR